MSPTKTVPTIRKFNPGVFQSDQEICEQFAVRHKEFDAVLRVVNRNLASESCQHVLIVAPRGMGKSMMLARMETELRLNRGLASKLLPVRFMEESYEVATLTDFWLEALFQFGRECKRQGLEAATELEAAHASLCARWRDTHLQLDVRAAIERGLASTGRRMVLMVENLQAISDAWDSDDEWGLRGILQTESSIMLIGTATTRFRSLEDADCAFFDLFRFIELGPLTTKECAALWNTATQQHLETREIRPFEILTGGSPRLLVLLAGVGRRLTLKQLLEDMVGLIDEHTEYFRQCLEGLPPGERRVFLALAALWEPASTSAIADRARMDIRTASVMVRRLMDRGAVSASAQRRSRRYSVTERMFSFYYSLRRERNQAEIIRRFIAFMVAFYDPSTATTAFADLGDDSDEAEIIRKQLLHTIFDKDAGHRWVERWDDEIKRETLHHLWSDVLNAMQRMVDQCSNTEFVDEVPLIAACRQLHRLPFTESRSTECIALAEFVTRYESKIPRLAVVELCTTILDLMDVELVDNFREYKLVAAQTKVVLARAHASSGHYELALDCCNQALALCTERPDWLFENVHAWATLEKQWVFMETCDFLDAKAESRNYLDYCSQRQDGEFGFFHAHSLFLLILAEIKTGNQADAQEALSELDRLFGRSQDRHEQLLVAHAMMVMHRYEAASEDGGGAERASTLADLILTRFGGSESQELCKVVANTVEWKASSLYGEHDLRSAERCLALGMEQWVSTATNFGLDWVVRVSVARAEILVQLGDYQEAEALVESWLMGISEIEGERGTNLWWRVELVLFLCYSVRGNTEAINVLGSIVDDFDPDIEYCQSSMVATLIKVGACGRFLDQIPAVLEECPQVRESMLPVIVALRKLNGEQVSAPQEVIEVALDVVKTIKSANRTGHSPGSLR